MNVLFLEFWCDKEEMQRNIPVPLEFKSIEDFNINEYSQFIYHINKVTPQKVYYRCSIKSCSATATATLNGDFICILEKRSHDHPPNPIKNPSKEQVRSFTKKFISQPPSQIQLQFIKSNEDSDVPPLSAFQNAKKNILRGIF